MHYINVGEMDLDL